MKVGVSIGALSFFNVANRRTCTLLFKRDMTDPVKMETRRKNTAETVDCCARKRSRRVWSREIETPSLGNTRTCSAVSIHCASGSATAATTVPRLLTTILSGCGCGLEPAWRCDNAVHRLPRQALHQVLH